MVFPSGCIFWQLKNISEGLTEFMAIRVGGRMEEVVVLNDGYKNRCLEVSLPVAQIAKLCCIIILCVLLKAALKHILEK